MVKVYFASLAIMALLGLVMSAPLDGDDTEEIEGETLSNLALLPDSDDNSAELDGNQAVFVPFCKEMLRFITDKVTAESDSVKSQVFNVIFSSSQQIAGDALESGNQAIEQLTERLHDPSIPLDDSDESDVTQNIINESARKIRDKATKSDLLESAKAVLSVIASKAFNSIQQNLANVRAMVKPQAVAILSQGCDRFQSDYMTHVVKQFNYARERLQDAAAEEPEHVKMAVEIGTTRLEDLKCKVTKKLVRANTACDLMQGVSPLLMKMATNQYALTR